MKKYLPAVLILGLAISGLTSLHAQEPGHMKISKQSRKVSARDKSGYVAVNEIEYWDPANTAIIICDMWDQHWCKSSEDRVSELAPVVDQVVKIAREKGVLIVHSPSDVVDYYEGTPQRELGKKYPDKNLGKLLSRNKLDSEEQAVWPIDQSDGGCDGETELGEDWPWTRQHEAIEILKGDAISDSGEEIAGLFKNRGITNVILMGVHVNMCIVNRPFGLRNMVRLGKNVVLMRDLTDAMYNPDMDPRVSHFEGNRLMIEYIEKYISPTIVSTDFTGERPFRFKEDFNYAAALALPGSQARFPADLLRGESIRGLEKPNGNVLQGHLSATLVHLGNIAYRAGNRHLHFDPEKECFTNCDHANQFLKTSYREHYTITDEVKI